MNQPPHTLPAAPWHAGEQELQRRAGSRERLAQVGPRILRDHMPEEHRDFFAELPWLLAGHLDASGQPWASVVAGPRGFIASPDAHSLRVAALPPPGDPLADGLVPGAPVGLLGLQPHTRRRNRMNGWIAAVTPDAWEVRVGQSFGNCPKYIQPREAVHAPAPAAGVEVHASAGLDAAARQIVARADTFFIATAHPAARASGDPAQGVDISHRGGPAGFVRRWEGDELVVPDYLGNAFFNTLGNLQLEPRCGLLFLDVATGSRLYLAAQARVQWDGPEVAAMSGAQRLLRLRVTGVRRVEGGLPLVFR